MKVIRVDNYDRDNWHGDEKLMSNVGLSQEVADETCRKLRESPDRPDDAWYRVVPDDHVLRRWEP